MFLDLGYLPLGAFVPLLFSSQTGVGVPTAPDACPTIKTYDCSSLGAAVETIRPGAKDLQRYTGLFYYALQLGGSYAINKTYLATLRWTITSGFVDVVRWQTVAGGDADGAAVGAVYVPRPEAKVILHVLDGGKLKAAKNPR